MYIGLMKEGLTMKLNKFLWSILSEEDKAESNNAWGLYILVSVCIVYVMYHIVKL